MVDGPCLEVASTTATLWRINAGHRGHPPHQTKRTLTIKGALHIGFDPAAAVARTCFS